MSVGPFPLAAVILRLQTAVPDLKIVDGAAGLLAAEKQQPANTPAAYVIGNEKSSAPKGYSGGVLAQECTVTIVVVLYVRHAGQVASGAKAQLALDDLRGKVRAALVNWKPTGHKTALHHIASDGESFQAGSLQGQEAFGTRYTIEQGLPQ